MWCFWRLIKSEHIWPNQSRSQFFFRNLKFAHSSLFSRIRFQNRNIHRCTFQIEIHVLPIAAVLVCKCLKCRFSFMFDFSFFCAIVETVWYSTAWKANRMFGNSIFADVPHCCTYKNTYPYKCYLVRKSIIFQTDWQHTRPIKHHKFHMNISVWCWSFAIDTQSILEMNFHLSFMRCTFLVCHCMSCIGTLSKSSGSISPLVRPEWSLGKFECALRTLGKEQPKIPLVCLFRGFPLCIFDFFIAFSFSFSQKVNK